MSSSRLCYAIYFSPQVLITDIFIIAHMCQILTPIPHRTSLLSLNAGESGNFEAAVKKAITLFLAVTDNVAGFIAEVMGNVFNATRVEVVVASEYSKHALSCISSWFLT